MNTKLNNKIKNIISLTFSIIFLISIIPNTFAKETKDLNSTVTQNQQEQIKLPDLGIKINHVTKRNATRINEIADELTQIAGVFNTINETKQKSIEANEAFAIASVRIKSLEEELLELGATKLTEEQKMLYVYGTEWDGNNNIATTSSIPGINYPNVSGIDFYIFEYTVNWGDGDYDMVNCIASPTPNVSSKMVRTSSWVDIYSDLSISSLVNKSIRFTAEEITDNILTSLTGGTITFVAGLLWNLSGNPFPSKTSNTSVDLTLKVTSSSRVIHYWVKINGTYYFRLSTCAAEITESWHLVDVNGTHYYKSNIFWAYSKYHISGGDERAAALNTNEAHGISIPYKSKGSVSWLTKLTVEPYTAALPIHFSY